MTETIADRWRRRAQAFADTVSAVPTERWDAASPCEGWTALDILEHVIQTQSMFAGMIGRTITPGPDPASDPLGAWVAARDQTQALLDDPATATTEFDGFIGHSSYQDAVDGFLGVDQVIHRWDLARAAGVDDTIPEADLDHLDEALPKLAARVGDHMRSGPFGPELQAPEGADRQTRMLAYLGRKAW